VMFTFSFSATSIIFLSWVITQMSSVYFVHCEMVRSSRISPSIVISCLGTPV